MMNLHFPYAVDTGILQRLYVPSLALLARIQIHLAMLFHS